MMSMNYQARPNQSLITHILNQVTAFNTIKSQFNPKFHQAIVEMLIFHDIGKMNSWFQQKLKSPHSLSARERMYSYHWQLSCLIFSFYCYAINNKKSLMVTQIYALFAIASHHDPLMLDLADKRNLTLSEAEVLLVSLKTINFDDLISLLQYLKEQIQEKLQLICLSQLEHKISKNGTNSSISNFKLLVTQFTTLKPSKLTHFWTNSLFAFQPKKENLSPILLTLFSSLLFNLDVWDARFHNPNHDSINASSHFFPFRFKVHSISKDIVNKYYTKKFGPINNKKNSNSSIINQIRNHLRQSISQLSTEELEAIAGNIAYLDAPTGSGKTLALLNFAFKMRAYYEEQHGYSPQIIYCLPFVALGNQIGAQVRQLFQISPDNLAQTSQLIVHNYVTPLKYKLNRGNSPDYIQQSNSAWHITNWHADIIITTFVQVFNTLFDTTKNNWIRMNHLAGSILLLDEIQTIPVKYWDLIGSSIVRLAEETNTTVVLSTATQPVLIESTMTKIPLYNLGQLEKTQLANQLNRYDIYWHPEIQTITQLHKLVQQLTSTAQDNLMIVVNTTFLAYQLYDLYQNQSNEISSYKIYLLSGLILPIHRMELLREITDRLTISEETKNIKQKTLLISTQLIEAGVDISFDIVIRDIAPLDSIVQVAGRCNRSGNPEKGKVHIVNLKDSNNYGYADMVYNEDSIDLIKTKILLSKNLKYRDKSLQESQLRSLFSEYYSSTREQRLTSKGKQNYQLLNFSKIRDDFSLIQEINSKKHLFIPINNEAIDLYTKMVETETKKSIFPRKFYQYSISINPKRLNSTNYKIEILHEQIEFLVLTNKSLYSKDGGLKITEELN